jgi:hypothetical protein
MIEDHKPIVQTLHSLGEVGTRIRLSLPGLFVFAVFGEPGTLRLIWETREYAYMGKMLQSPGPAIRLCT